MKTELCLVFDNSGTNLSGASCFCRRGLPRARRHEDDPAAGRVPGDYRPGCSALFLSDRLRYDVVAALALCCAALTGGDRPAKRWRASPTL